MQNKFRPIYKEVERPLIGFECESSGGNKMEVKITFILGEQYCRFFFPYIPNSASHWSKENLQEFINNLQKVCDNMK
jgi:hypothetical protein